MSANLWRVKRCFKPCQNEHDSMKEAEDKGKKKTWIEALRKQLTFSDASIGFPSKWRLINEGRDSRLMTLHSQDLGSASDWLNQISHVARPIRSITQILIVTGDQYGISALVSQTSFGGETSCSVAKCRLFSQATWKVDSENSMKDPKPFPKNFPTKTFPPKWSLLNAQQKKRKWGQKNERRGEERKRKEKDKTDFYTFNILNPKTFCARPNFAS